jgi:hypothetical protein
MKHQHQCVCEHNNIKLCKVCKVPYCVDCGKEWQEKVLYNTYYSTCQYPNIYQHQTTGGRSDVVALMTNADDCGHRHESDRP